MIVNTDLPGTAKWNKVDDQTPAHKIGGSVWSLLGPTGANSSTVSVTDNTGQAGYTGLDLNPAAGEFELGNLKWGDYTLTETEAPEGYELSDQPPSFSFTIDSTYLSYAHQTPIVNSRILGKAYWQKVDADNGEQLSGSEWSLVGPAGPTSDSVTVIDNTGQLGYVGLDTDPVAGAFEIANLGWGSYTLTETKAPAGYYLSDSPPSFTFTIDAEHLVFAPANPVENQKMQVPGVPITGGLGSDAFTIAGSAFLLVALALLGMARRRRSAL